MGFKVGDKIRLIELEGTAMDVPGVIIGPSKDSDYHWEVKDRYGLCDVFESEIELREDEDNAPY